MSEAFKLAPHEWALLRALLDEALALPATKRDAWLQVLNEERAQGLKPRLQSLLTNATDDDPTTGMRLLETLPKVETNQFAPLPGSATEKPGDTVGPYRLIRELGSGGMGSVWLAERTDMLQGRQVALKLPHGAWKRAGLAERMAREREILATLEHPNIARLYDAGVAEDGQPWLALEFVEGERIDRHAQRTSLDAHGRVRLVLQVLGAVAHAHAQLVVHRDLKPANILVTEAGQVKLLDFGIAKLVAEGTSEETELTRAAGRAFTPEYASPEQILGQPLGTASDVYSMGVVLFELLTDVRPYRLARTSRAALEEAITAGDLPRPSALAPVGRRKAMRGDLDAIVLQALKSRPSERYQNAQALIDDLNRWFERRPVLAQPDRAAYRFRRYAVRHRLSVAAGTMVARALVVGSAMAIWQARSARTAEMQARHEAELARQAARVAEASLRLAEYMLVDLSDGRSPEDIERQLDRAVIATRAQHAEDPQVRATLLGSIAGRMRQLGRLERFHTVAAEALAAARLADDGDLQAHIECWLALEDAEAGELSSAMTRIDAALAGLADGRLRSRDATGTTQTRRSCMLDRAGLLQIGGDPGAAVATIQAVQAFERENHIRDAEALADTHMRLANALNAVGEHRGALQSIRATLSAHERAGRASSASGMNTRLTLARILLDGGQPLAALDALALLRGGPQAPWPAPAERTLAAVLLGAGRSAEALEAARRAWQSLRAGGHPAYGRAAARTAAEAARRLGRLEEAHVWMQRAGEWPLSREPAFGDRGVMLARAAQLLALGRPNDAKAIADQAEALMAGRLANDGVRRTLDHLQARIALARRDTPEALLRADTALARAQAQAVDSAASVWIAEALLLHADALAAEGNLQRSAHRAGEAVEQFIRSADAQHPGLRSARCRAAAKVC